MSICKETRPEINQVFAECKLGFDAPCNPKICPIPAEDCYSKIAVLEAQKNANCISCWLVDGNTPSYMRGQTFYPNLNAARCAVLGKERCPIFELITIRTAAMEARYPENQNSKGNGFSKSCI